MHLAVLLARVGGDDGCEVLQFSLIYELAQFLGVEFLSELLQRAGRDATMAGTEREPGRSRLGDRRELRV